MLYDTLMREYPNETTKVLENLYNEKFPNVKKDRAPKTVFKFRVLGKEYDDTIFVHNYESFFSDVAKIIPFDKIRSAIRSSNFSDANVFAKEDTLCINGQFYINTKTPTKRKIIHVMKVCEYLNANIEEIKE